MGANGVGQAGALLAAGQWMTDPDGNPATADQPSVINNSWAAGSADDTWFRPMIKRWLDLGIVPVFAAGNTGADGPGTVASPAAYPEAVAVGAMDDDFTIPSFSGRGPIVWKNSDGQGPAAGTVLAKPDLVAPGVGIASTVPRGYDTYSGTSMASPHVAGVAALLRQLNPALSPRRGGRHPAGQRVRPGHARHRRGERRGPRGRPAGPRERLRDRARHRLRPHPRRP